MHPLGKALDVPVLSKEDFNALEQVFAAEIEGRLPFQSKKKIYKKLETDGYVTFYQEQISSKLGPIIVKGWRLTFAGNFVWCMNCPDEKPEEKDCP